MSGPTAQYKETPAFTWEDAPAGLLETRAKIEEEYGIRFDYVLSHVYRDGNDHIGFHRDKEALNTDVVSVSFGASRRFQLRPVGAKLVVANYTLSHGDTFHMKGTTKEQKGCQQLYKHRVPKMDIQDLVRHIEGCGLALPKGRKTYKALNSIVAKNRDREGVDPVRINFTFRKFE